MKKLKNITTCILTATFLSFAIMFFPFRVQAQRFWLTTYEFPYGPKTGITMAKNNCLYVGIENGVIKSCDEGNHFEISLESSAVYTIFSTREGKVLAGGVGKIFFTDNSGQNWDSISINSTCPVIQFAENSMGDLFAITSDLDNENEDYAGDGVFYSNDNGISWIDRNSGLGVLKSCERINIDKNDRLYLACADKFVSGYGGLFISDDNGMNWNHINVTIDGKNTIDNHIKVGTTLGLTISPDDSLHFSFSGIAVNTYVEINCRKSIYDIENNNFWKTYQISSSNLWWDDKNLFDIYFAKNGDRYSSTLGSINTGATYYSSNGSGNWVKVDYGLGLNFFGLREKQFFAENDEGKIFMVQWLDERVYWTDASILTSTKPIEESLTDMNLFPNPVNRNENFSIRLDNNNNDVCRINVYDSLGRKIISDTVQDNIHHMQAPVKSGIYYIEIAKNHTRKTAKLLVK